MGCSRFKNSLKYFVARLWALFYGLKYRNGTSDLNVIGQVFILRHYQYSYSPDFSPKVIIDAGANIGCSAIFFSRRFPHAKIYALEPDGDNFKMLIQNTRKYSNIIPINAALYGHDTVLQVVDNGYGAWGLQTLESTGTEAKNVPAFSVPTLMKKWQVEKIDILKMDIEGAEKSVFQENAKQWLALVKIFFIETHDRMTPGTSTELFKAFGEVSGFDLSLSGEILILENKNK